MFSNQLLCEYYVCSITSWNALSAGECFFFKIRKICLLEKIKLTFTAYTRKVTKSLKTIFQQGHPTNSPVAQRPPPPQGQRAAERYGSANEKLNKKYVEISFSNCTPVTHLAELLTFHLPANAVSIHRYRYHHLFVLLPRQSKNFQTSFPLLVFVSRSFSLFFLRLISRFNF